RIVLASRSTSARVVIISLTNSPRPPENSLHRVRNGALVIPAIGARTTGGWTVCGPIRSCVRSVCGVCGDCVMGSASSGVLRWEGGADLLLSRTRERDRQGGDDRRTDGIDVAFNHA